MSDTPRTEAGRILASNMNVTAQILAIEAEARTEALDVEVLARVMEMFRDASDHYLHLSETGGAYHLAGSAEFAATIAGEYRAILAGETERG